MNIPPPIRKRKAKRKPHEEMMWAVLRDDQFLKVHSDGNYVRWLSRGWMECRIVRVSVREIARNRKPAGRRVREVAGKGRGE